jgi:hypothetical protein
LRNFLAAEIPPAKVQYFFGAFSIFHLLCESFLSFLQSSHSTYKQEAIAMRKSKNNIQKTTDRSASTTIKQKLTKRKVPNTTHEEMKCSHILLPSKSTTNTIV